jgi:hypothetical protein
MYFGAPVPLGYHETECVLMFHLSEREMCGPIEPSMYELVSLVIPWAGSTARLVKYPACSESQIQSQLKMVANSQDDLQR